MDRDIEKRVADRQSLKTASAVLAATLVLGVTGLVTCVSQDPVAPEGSVITVTANPQTVVVQGGVAGQTKITATLRSKNGTRLPDQEVIFSTSSGTLTPPAQSAVITDAQGQANTKLDTTSSATVTAFSGAIMGSTTVNVVSGNLSSITLNPASGSSTDLPTCNDVVDLVVDAQDPNGAGVSGVTIIFSTTSISGRTLMQGSFNPTQPRTGATGVALTTFTPSASFCTSHCDLSVDPNAANGGACGIRVVAKDVSGAFASPSLDITESVQ